MPINPNCKVKVTHTSRPGKVAKSTWANVGWICFGGNATILKNLLKQLRDTGRASYTDESGTLNIKLLGNINGS